VQVIYGYSQDHMWDIDTEEDWQRTERYINSTR
jgi:CMP-N-acetylneuraminic acid synthetase